MPTQIRGTNIRDNSVTGADVDELTLILPHFTTHKYTNTSGSDTKLIRFNAAGSDNTGGAQVNNKFLAPAAGKLMMVKIRTDNAMGNTEIALMKASNGTNNFGDPGSPATDVTVNVASADTAYDAIFSSNNTFSAGDVLGIRINPTNNHGNVDLVCVWELDFSI
jgi:hypothetical protein